MKYLFFLLIGFNCFAEYSVKITWDKNDPSENVVNYKLYRSTDETNWSVVVESPENLVQDNNLNYGTKYYWYVTALNSYGLESDPSNVISFFRSGISSQSIEIIDGQKYQVAIFQLDPSIGFEVQATTDLNVPMQTIQTEIIRENNLVTIKVPMDQDKLFWRVVFLTSFNDGVNDQI